MIAVQIFCKTNNTSSCYYLQIEFGREKSYIMYFKVLLFNENYSNFNIYASIA